MNNIKKIFIDNNELNLNSLIANKGKYNIGYTNKKVNVEILLKDNTYIPSYMFAYCNTIDSVHIPKTIRNIETGAFANSYMSYISGLSENITISNGVFYNTYITKDILENQHVSYTSYLFYDPVTNTTYTNIPENNNEGNNEGNNEEINVGQYTDDIYEVAEVYRLPLIYTERTGQKREQQIGTVDVEIIEIDDTVEHSDQYKLKIQVREAYIDNPLDESEVDFYNEIVGRYFYVQDTFITADIDFFSTLPGWRQGIDGVDTFFAMKGEGDTYYPELENFSGVTDYAIRKTSNELIKV